MERTCWYIILAYISCAYCTPYYYRESKQHSEHHREYSSEGSSGHESPTGLEGTEALQFSPKPVPEKYYSGLYPTLGSSPLQGHSSGYSFSSGSLYQAPVAVTHASMQQGSMYQSPLTVSHGSVQEASMYQSPVTVTRLTAQPVFYSSPPAGNVVVRKIVKVYKYPATGTQSGYVQVVQSKSGSENLGREIYGQNIGSDLTLGQKEINVKNVEGLFGKYFQGGDHPGYVNKEITMVKEEHGGRGKSLYGRRADSLETGQKEVSEEFGQQPVDENYETGQREESLYPVENKKLELGQREESFHHSEHIQVGQKEESLYPIQQNEKVQLGQQVTSIYARKPSEPLELGQKEEISGLEVGQEEESLYHSSHSGREVSIHGSQSPAQKEQRLYPILPAHNLELGQREESTNIDLSRKEESLYHSTHSSHLEVGQREESSGLELPQKEESLYSNSRRGDSEPGEKEEPSSGLQESSHSLHRVVIHRSPTVYYSNQNSFSLHPQNGKTENLDLGQREESSSFELGQREEGLQGLGGSHNSEIGQREESFSQHGLEVGQREESFSQHSLELGQKEEPLRELGQKEESLSGHYIELGQKEEPLELGQKEEPLRELGQKEESFSGHYIELGQKEEPLEFGQKEESLSGQQIELGQKEESFGGKYIELGQREEPVNEQHIELGQKEESLSGQHIELGQKEESFSAGNFELGQREEPLSGQHIDLGQKEEPLSGRHIELGQKEESFSGGHFELGQKEESFSGGHFELGQREEPLTGKYSTFSIEKENKNDQSGNFHLIQRPVVVSSVTQVGKISKLENIGGSGVINSQRPIYQGSYSAQGITCEHGHRHSHGGFGTGQRGHYLQIMQNGESNRGSSPNQIRDKNYKSLSGIYDIGQKEESLDLEHLPNNDKSLHKQTHEEYHEVSVVKSQTSSHRSVAGHSPDETSTRKAFPVFPVSVKPNRGSGINLNKKIEDLAMELELESIARKPSIPRDSLTTTLEGDKREVTTRSTTPVHEAEIQELGFENFNRRTTSDLSGFGETPQSRINVFESHKEEIGVNYPESRRTYSKKHSRQYSARSESQSIVVPAKVEEYSVQSQGSSGAFNYRQGYSPLQGGGYVNDQPVQQQQMSKTEFLGSSQQGNKHAVIDEFLTELEKDIARSGGKRTQTGYVQVSSQQQPASSGTSLYSERTHTSHSSSSSSSTGSGDKSWFQKVGDKIGSSYNKAVDKIGTTYSQAKEKAKEIVDSVKQKAGY